MQILAKGANAPLPPGPVAVRVTAAAPVDISALLVTAEGTVRGDADFVFYNQPTAPGVRHDPAGVSVEGFPRRARDSARFGSMRLRIYTW